MPKLTKKIVTKVKSYHTKGFTQKQIAYDLDLSQGLVSLIINADFDIERVRHSQARNNFKTKLVGFSKNQRLEILRAMGL